MPRLNGSTTTSWCWAAAAFVHFAHSMIWILKNCKTRRQKRKKRKRESQTSRLRSSNRGRSGFALFLIIPHLGEQLYESELLNDMREFPSPLQRIGMKARLFSLTLHTISDLIMFQGIFNLQLSNFLLLLAAYANSSYFSSKKTLQNILQDYL